LAVQRSHTLQQQDESVHLMGKAAPQGRGFGGNRLRFGAEYPGDGPNRRAHVLFLAISQI
jgi:hypothetical protein